MSLNDENNEHDENIVINIDVDENHNNENIDNFNNKDHENELETILNEINNFSYSVIENNNNNNGNSWYSNSVLIAKSIDYDTNYNVKQLLTICDYYGLLKEVKLNKFKKPELILFLLDFEENMENSFIVYKRKQLWHFVEELKNDKFMKKYILW
jgi:hypothetical protein